MTCWRRFITGNAENSASASGCPPVHPREYGERKALRRARASATGSSPRVRGTHYRYGSVRESLRFIPASTGNAMRRPAVTCSPTVHPREYGERPRCCAPPGPASGSSPRVRGTHEDYVCAWLSNRFIPASTGNASTGCVAGHRTTVHPREYGERGGNVRLLLCIRGSSPRVRGTQCERRRGVSYNRFIPASTGNAIRSSITDQALTVHPREYGERR